MERASALEASCALLEQKASAMEASCALLEQRHVHDVYEKTAHHFRDTNYKAWPKVKQFLKGLEPGSLVADVGCGTGRYLGINSNVFKLGCDHCCHLVEIARDHDHEVMVCDNLRLPYRDNSFDTVISVAVIHHLTTTERRLVAVQELARILRPGGKLMIYVWAMEQKHRKFKSQDVLVPWHMKTNNQQYREKKKLKFEMERSSTNSISEDDEGDSSRNTSEHQSSPAQTLTAHVETCSESPPISESTHSRVINSLKSKGETHAQTINAAYNANIVSKPSEQSIELLTDAGEKVEKSGNNINGVVSLCTGLTKKPSRRRAGIPSRLRQHLTSLFRGHETLQEELDADINPRKLIQNIMMDKRNAFPCHILEHSISDPTKGQRNSFPCHILEHSISDPTIEGFAVREFPQSSQMRSASTDCEPCDNCSEANDLTCDSSVMYTRQCETIGDNGEGAETHPTESTNGVRHNDAGLTDTSCTCESVSLVGHTSSSSVINKFHTEAATVINKCRSEENNVVETCSQETVDEHYDDVFQCADIVSVLEGDVGNIAQSYHADNGHGIGNIAQSYHADNGHGIGNIAQSYHADNGHGIGNIAQSYHSVNGHGIGNIAQSYHSVNGHGIGNIAQSYHSHNDISEVRSTLRRHSYHEDAIDEDISRQVKTLNVTKDSVLSSIPSSPHDTSSSGDLSNGNDYDDMGTDPSDVHFSVGTNYTDSIIGSNYDNHRNDVMISHNDTDADTDGIRSRVNVDDDSRDITEGTVTNGDVRDNDASELSKDQSSRHRYKKAPPLVRNNSDNDEWARRTAEAIEAIQSQVLKGAANSQQVELDLGPLQDKLNGASQSCATSCSSCDLYSESSTDDDNTENGLNSITSATSILTNTDATTNSEKMQGSTVDKTRDCASDTGDNNDTFKRFYHVFCEGELVELIEKNVECLDIVSAYYDHANWCVVAEKVHVWKI